ncbi:hemolysin family protein [Massilioclostridium coli]|uniref:hemolysin family protein n=1 Tax=Massilioclostridium coli TaxID=1870991 RepID=UPI0022E399D3|nr:hemolysin family protein [Massilioclostridium coli]
MTTILLQLLLQVVLIALNAFFAASEIAVISLNTNKLRKQAESGDKSAKKILKISETPAKFLSTIQIGITLAGFLGSAFAADNFSDPLVDWMVNTLGFHSISPSALNTITVILITIILSYFTLIFGELVPKRIAMQKPMAIAKLAANVVSFIAVVMKPVIWFLSVSTNGVLRLLGMKTKEEDEAVTEEEILMMMDLGEEKGTIQKGKREMIKNIFEFDDTPVKEVMTRRMDMVALSDQATTEEILYAIHTTGFSRFPVYHHTPDHVTGILYAKEYLLNLRAEHPKTLRQLLHAAYFIPETIHSDILFRNMQAKKIHIAVVINEYGETSGIVTLEDLLEEIVGNIYDEFDPSEEKEIYQIKKNCWCVSGTLPLDMLEDELNIQLPEELEVDTVGGLVFSQLKEIPRDGTKLHLECYGLIFDVTKVENRHVTQVFIRKKQDGQTEQMQASTPME